ncbi:TetR/AcrR family transcriptional regulator [Sporosarcina sp. Te-1]|uniref:TetR/AcrR family transcriptional regulator n=1 Tax=Sporosarcina sp. Te-1 TaxID=2818390 RepID=UPI001A9D1EBC|nr:TetR/AcrR family transcriptional regulator [Sporosarcina sp. Te-1]QTD39669.1 TetR/AcrR family transcriptional regulator [Sporosarcina sp. Te-1]
MSARRTANEELSKETILDTARQLFIENGYEKTSMRQVATALQCSHGAIYYHFKNKADLFQAVVSHDFSKLDLLIDEILETDWISRDKCRAIFLKYIEFGLQNKSHYEMMFMLKDQEVQGYLHDHPNQSYGKFADAIHTLTDGTLSIKDMWCLFLSLHGFVSYYCYTSQTYEDVQVLAEAHVAFLMKGI